VARLILDTSFLVTAERSGTPLAAQLADEDDLVIAAITATELLLGVQLADARHKAARETYVSEVFELIPIEDYDLAVARVHASLLHWTRRAGAPRGAHDLMIAATAVATGRTVVTSDIRGFDGLPGVTVQAH
jgi:tRNA(fMet)-specific endonuclease VapC